MCALRMAGSISDLVHHSGGEVRGQGSVALYPELERAKYGPYKEAWELLRGHRRVV